MVNFTASRSARRGALTLARAGARGHRGSLLAGVAFSVSAVLACSVYEDPHSGAAAPVAVGGSASAGSGAAAGSDTAGGSAGKSSPSNGGSGASDDGGSGGVAGTGGSDESKGGAGVAGSVGDGAASGGGAGTAGTSASGGTAGGSVGGGGQAGQPSGAVALIDDMEDDDAQITQRDGRDGFWYVGNDGTVGGTQEPVATAFTMSDLTSGERTGSSYAARMKVSGYSGWGSVIGFNLIEILGAVKPYDASSYCGLSFWAKAAATTALRVRLPDGDTHPAGNVCVDGGATNGCYDHFGKNATFTATWTKFDVLFSELDQAGAGYHPADKKLKPSQLFAIEWAVPGANKAYEIWIDDVSFLPCQ
jgi:hypothetical protein